VDQKEWLENRLEELAEIFAVAGAGFSVIATISKPARTHNRIESAPTKLKRGAELRHPPAIEPVLNCM
jgi:hypothetical protein